MGGAKDVNPEKLGRKPLEEGGFRKKTITAGGPSVMEENRERNISLLPGLLC